MHIFLCLIQSMHIYIILNIILNFIIYNIYSLYLHGFFLIFSHEILNF
jgi:hypothetical protein